MTKLENKQETTENTIMKISKFRCAVVIVRNPIEMVEQMEMKHRHRRHAGYFAPGEAAF